MPRLEWLRGGLGLISKTTPIFEDGESNPSRENQWSRLTPEMIAEYEKLGGEVHNRHADKSQPIMSCLVVFEVSPDSCG